MRSILTFCNHIAVDETVRYTPHPNDPGKTLLQQEAVVTVSGVPLTHYMEELLTSKICFNSGMGRQAMEWVIEKLHLEEFDDLLTQTVRQFDDLTSKTRRGMDDLQSAIKSFDEIHNLTKDELFMAFSIRALDPPPPFVSSKHLSGNKWCPPVRMREMKLRRRK
ncbi:protein slowmo, partial [Vespula squamosa]